MSLTFQIRIKPQTRAKFEKAVQATWFYASTLALASVLWAIVAIVLLGLYEASAFIRHLANYFV